MKGKVIFFNRKKGWGLIQQEDPTDSIMYFHYKNINEDWRGSFLKFRSIPDGAEVTWHTTSYDNKPGHFGQAIGVTRVQKKV